MSASGFAALVAVALAVAAIAFVWKRVASEPGSMGDGTPGSVMDANEDVRRIDLGTHTYVAQQAQAQLTGEGYTCRAVSLEEGAFGIGLGSHHYLVYNAEDEVRVREVVDALLADMGVGSGGIDAHQVSGDEMPFDEVAVDDVPAEEL